MNHFRAWGLLGVVVAGTACERTKAPPPVDSTAVPNTRTPEVTAVAAGSSWDAGAGPLLLVAAASPTQAFVVVPDTASSASTLAKIPHPASVTLFGRGGTVQTADLPTVTDTGACITATLDATPPPRPWNIGFIGGVVAPLAMDSVESLSHADSASMVASMNRLASALPNDSAGRFSGLPFTVRSILRFAIPSGVKVVVATLTRQINQEATPLQEHTFLIAEQPKNDTTYAKAYAERSYGEEETIESRDVLAGALVGASRNPAIILVRDYGNATAYGLLERGVDGQWHARWTSARRHC